MAYTMQVNTQLMNSIPIDKNLKRYLIKWFSKMCECNGPSFAVDHVKNLRELLMRFIADPNNNQKLEQYVSEAPIRKNKRLYQLFRYGKTNPIAVLAFLKFYMGESETLVSVEASELEMHELLRSIHFTPSPIKDRPLREWLHHLNLAFKELVQAYWWARHEPNAHFHYVCSCHSCAEWLNYWTTWRRRLLKYPRLKAKDFKHKNNPGRIPVPSMYKDVGLDPYGQLRSEQFERDAQDFLDLFPDARGGNWTIPVNLLDDLLMMQETSRVFNLFELDDIVGDLDPDEWYVGQIHHIPKKGTTVRRPIAVPNRFLQCGLETYQRFLYDILRYLPRDHTFDQTKSSQYIKWRVDHNHYACSVDLSHATDYLPKSLGDEIIQAICPGLCSLEPDPEHPVHDDLRFSKQLFDVMSRAYWKNGPFLDRWTVGQPLGTLPSFGMLALEHNILLESTALACGYLHSPYTVLGDDVILFSKRMRRAYIDTMSKLGVPLSLHKSYEHNLVEFAGQIVVKNQPVSRNPDPSRVSWYNLFDFTRNSGIPVSYRELPHKIQERLSRLARKVSLTGAKFYRLCYELYSAYAGSPYHSYMDLSMRVLPFFTEVTESVLHLTPDPAELTSGWQPLTLYGEERLAYTGKGVIRKDNTNTWYREKYKPMTTNTIIANAMRAVALSTAP